VTWPSPHQLLSVVTVVTINSRDIVTIETATSLDPVEVDQSGAVPPSVVPEYQRAIHREVKDRYHPFSHPALPQAVARGGLYDRERRG
jgi:hypothetical protein